MTPSGLQDHDGRDDHDDHDRDASIEALLAAARHETLVLAVALAALDDDAATVASARLRWAIGAARALITSAEHEPGIARHADQLDRVANRAQRWLVCEPPRSPRAVGALIERVVARRGSRAPALDASHTQLVDLDLDGLDLARVSLRAASLTDLTLRRARCNAADASAAHWLRCDLDASSLKKAVLSGAILEHCNLSRATLSGASFQGATVSHSNLLRATLVDARLDGAVFTDCNLRGADLSLARADLSLARADPGLARADPGRARAARVASLTGTRFLRCDLRETCWSGRDLGGAIFIDCKLFGAHGAPTTTGVVIDRPDVSLLGDGSQLTSVAEVILAWRTMIGATANAVRLADRPGYESHERESRAPHPTLT